MARAKSQVKPAPTRSLLSYAEDPDWKTYGEKKPVFKLHRAPAKAATKGKKKDTVKPVLVCPVCLSEDTQDNYYCQACMVTAHKNCMEWREYPRLTTKGEVAVCRGCLSMD